MKTNKQTKDNGFGRNYGYKQTKETGYDENGDFDLCLKDKQDYENNIEGSHGDKQMDEFINGLINEKKNIPLNNHKLLYEEGYKQGRKDNQAKCEVCKREDCLTILCHADLKVFKQDIRKDAIDEILKEIDKQLEIVNGLTLEQIQSNTRRNMMRKQLVIIKQICCDKIAKEMQNEK
jgi:hypothetical protein